MDPHLRLGSSQDLYQCGVWTENFALKDKLGAHIRSTPPNYMNCCRCEVCGKLFSRISDLKTHLWVHTTKEKPFACDICSKTFGSLNSKNSHRRKVHRGELAGGSAGTHNSSASAPLPPPPHHHPQQQMQVVSQVHSSCHMQQGDMAHSRSPNESHAHLRASGPPSSHSHLQQPPQHAHSQSQQHPHQSSQAPPPHSLQQASAAGHHRADSHSHPHDHERSHQCHNASEASANRKHSPPCDVCGKTFAFTNYIKLHQTVHTKEKPFSCDLCPKRFSQPSSRNRHRKKSHKRENSEIGPLSLAPAHHGQGPGGGAGNPTSSGGGGTSQQSHQPKKNSPPCEVCGKTFAFKNYLKAHYRVHSKEKPYVCDLCFRRFTQASSRNFHRKRMHKEASLIEPTPQQMAMQPSVTANSQSSSTSHDQKPFHCKACVPTYHPTYNKQ